LGDFAVDSKTLLDKIKTLVTRKNASIVIVLDRKSHNNYIKQHGTLPPALKTLEDLGVRIQTVRDVHAKIIMVENNQDKCLLVTSANLTHTAYHKNHELGIYFHNEREDIYDSFAEYIKDLLVRNNP